MDRLKLVAMLVTLVTVSVCARAQQIGYAFDMLIPVVVESPSYASQVFIHNAGTSSATITVDYTGASGSALPGLVHCPSVVIAAGNVAKTSLGALCPSLNPGSIFGSLELSGSMDAAARRRPGVLQGGVHRAEQHVVRRGFPHREVPQRTLANARCAARHTVESRIAAIRSRHSRGPLSCTDSPFASTATVTGMSATSNS